MAQKTINKGGYPGDPSADNIQSGFDKVNDNFDELYLADTDLQSQIDDLEASQDSGVIGYADKATMDADTGQAIGTIAQVMNDSTASNNGYYRWSGSAWVKRDNLYATTLNPTDETEAVTGSAVDDHNLKLGKPDEDIVSANVNYKIVYDGTNVTFPIMKYFKADGTTATSAATTIDISGANDYVLAIVSGSTLTFEKGGNSTYQGSIGGLTKDRRIALYKLDGRIYSRFAGIRRFLPDLNTEKIIPNGTTEITLSPTSITIPVLRASNDSKSFFDMASAFTMPITSKFDYILGDITGGAFVLTKGSKTYAWQQIVSGKYLVAYSNDGIWYSDYPPVQALFDAYYARYGAPYEVTYGEYNNSAVSAFNSNGIGVNKETPSSKNGVITKLEFKPTQTGVAKFAIGTIDVNNVPSIEYTFEVDVTDTSVHEYAVSQVLKKNELVFAYIGPDYAIGYRPYDTAQTNLLYYNDTSISPTLPLNAYGAANGGYLNLKVTVTETLNNLAELETTIKEDIQSGVTSESAYGKWRDWGSNSFSGGGVATNDGTKATASGTITKILFNPVRTGTATFIVGLRDQWGYMIEASRFDVAVTSTSTYTYELATPQPIEKGQQLFALIGSTSPVGFSTNPSADTNYLLYNDADPTGVLNFYGGANGGFLNLRYAVQEITDNFDSVKSEISTLKERLSALEAKKTITANFGGTEYRLTTDGSNDAIWTPLIVNKAVALGNSITKHPLTTFWWGEWGMAATEESKDWVHQFEAILQTKDGSSVVNAQNIAGWEADHASWDKTQLDAILESDVDLVIINVGENVNNTTNFVTNYIALINYIKAAISGVQIVIGGNFWQSPSKDALMLDAANQTGSAFVSFSDMWTNASLYQQSIDTLVYGDDEAWHRIGDGYTLIDDGEPDTEANRDYSVAYGVASHPNDYAMLKMAQGFAAAIGY